MNSFRPAVAVMLFASLLKGQEVTPPQPAEKPVIRELIIVTASRTEQNVREAPAAVSVITSQDLEETPADDFGDVLRSVAGLNVTQISARDVQISARSAATSLSTSQLVLLDGRSLYLDFFGFVMWDFLPVNLDEIKQIEVVRGPGSAVWGANAMTGVINVITKRPAEMEGSTVTLGWGELGTRFANVNHAGARDRWSYKLSTGYYEQDAYERPTGLIPGTKTPYPLFENEGTRQPKADLRLDHDISESAYFTISSGYAAADGLVHTGIGPFDMESGSSMTYAKGEWIRRAFRASAFANFLDADSTNLLARGVTGRPISFAFKTDTYNVDVSNTSVVRERYILTYGAQTRHSEFALSIAPRGNQRDEYGAFIQTEMLAGKARFVVGGRFDHLDPIGSVVSPRTTFLYSVSGSHTFRLSYGRAFRAPSLINNYLDTAILNQVALPTGLFPFATKAVGNPALNEERMHAYEMGYAGTLSRGVTAAVNVYRNDLKDSTDFYADAFYTSANPPAGWPLPVALLDVAPLRNALPSSFSYRNIGRIVNEGIEVDLHARTAGPWSWFANYSWQRAPEVDGIPPGEVNVPPSHRANGGIAFHPRSWFVNANANYQSAAIWRDVLDARFWGPTHSFTCVNGAAGVRLKQEAITLSLTGTNLLDKKLQQHVFGDILSRKITAQIRFRL